MEPDIDVQQVEESDVDELPGVVRLLGELGPGTIISEAALARMLDRHPASIKRAVKRGELPHPTRLLGGPVWTAGSIVRHIEGRLERAAKEAEREARRLEQYSP